MRIAILSDIHGNVWALRAVLARARRLGIDGFVNLGDVLYGPLRPRETFEVLASVAGVTVQGNQDREISEASREKVASNPTLAFVIKDLGEEPVQWLRMLADSCIVYDEVFCCHGAPGSDEAYLLEDVRPGFPVVRPERDVSAELQGIDQPLVLCGHSHIQRVVSLFSGIVVVNPGSVGLPAFRADSPVPHRMETCSPQASFAVIEKEGGLWHTELCKVAYDHTLAAREAEKNGRQDWAHWLRTGRVELDK